jgi:hyaluronoglucosaminidase
VGTSPAATTPISPSSALDHLSPVPAFATVDGPPVLLAEGAVRRGSDPDGDVWRELADLDPGTLREDGYALRIREVDGRGEAVLAATDGLGLFRGRTTLEVLRGTGAPLPQLSIRDEPALAWRGTIEGFYGAPWSHADRLAHLRFAARNKLNSYSYAPKDDPYHRERWRDPYPADLLAQLGELVDAARELAVKFTYTIHPGLSMVCSSPEDRELLYRKAEQLWSIGVRSFALLFDDIPKTLQHEADIAAYGADERATGVAHGDVCRDFADRFLAPRGGDRLVMVPTDYAGTQESPYRAGLADTLPQDALVWWTGHDIVVGEVTREHIDAAARAFDRDLLLWDNFPVNDFDAKRLFLGPLVGRATELTGSRLVGISANPMVQASASQFALVTVADWAWNPSAYDPTGSARRALPAVAGSLAGALRPLVEACSVWPPDAARAPELASALPRALEGETEALAQLDAALTELAGLPEAVAGEAGPLVEELRPWLTAAASEAAVAREAVALLAERRPLDADARTRLTARAEVTHDVLGTMLGDFTRSALDRLPPR